jgi:hypothetical protein
VGRRPGNGTRRHRGGLATTAPAGRPGPRPGRPGAAAAGRGWGPSGNPGPIRERVSRARLARPGEGRRSRRDGRRRQRCQAGGGGPRAGQGPRDMP